MPVPPPPEAKKIFEGELLSIYRWPQKLYDGTTKIFDCAIRPDTLVVLAFLDNKTVLMTKQEQPHRIEPFWSLPGGCVDPGETSEQAAQRELLEETGYRAGRLKLFGGYKHSGLVRFEFHMFVATDLTRDPGGAHEDAGEKIQLVPISWNELVQKCLRRELRGSDTMLPVLTMQYDPDEHARLQAFLSGH